MYVFVGTNQSSATHRQHPDSNPSNPACAGRPSTPSIRAWGMAECVADDRLELSHIVCRRRSMTSKPTSLQQTSLAAYFFARSQRVRCARTRPRYYKYNNNNNNNNNNNDDNINNNDSIVSVAWYRVAFTVIYNTHKQAAATIKNARDVIVKHFGARRHH